MKKTIVCREGGTLLAAQLLPLPGLREKSTLSSCKILNDFIQGCTKEPLTLEGLIDQGFLRCLVHRPILKPPNSSELGQNPDLGIKA